MPATPAHIAAESISRDFTYIARNAPENEPVQWVTGNRYMPPLRSDTRAEEIWQTNDPDAWEELVETLERLLGEANVLMDAPDYDNALYVVDLARFEYVEEPTGDSLQDEWQRRES